MRKGLPYGTLIDEHWRRFPRENRFPVGVCIDDLTESARSISHE
jgi:hypothetical protein